MNAKYKEIASVFFRLGCFAFGGPAAHIAMMEDEIVTKRKWMDRQHFLDLIGATNLIPGPNSTEMAIHCGYQRGGIVGLILSGVCFIFPAVLITGALAWVYVEYGELPEIKPFLYGIKPAVIGIILMAVHKLSKKAVKSWVLAVIGIGVAALNFLGVNELIAILGGGIIGMIILLAMGAVKKDGPKKNWLPLLGAGSLGKLGFPLLLQVGVTKIPLMSLFGVFLKIGAVLFGSGYVLIAYLEGELVDQRGWLTSQELLDAVAIGQFTPGPVLSTATFIGFQIDGVWGAVVATLGIFLPSFFFVAALNPLVPKIRKSRYASAFLDAVNVSALGLMLAVTITLSINFMSDWRSALIAVLSVAVALAWKKANAMYIVIGGALLGYGLSFLG